MNTGRWIRAGTLAASAAAIGFACGTASTTPLARPAHKTSQGPDTATGMLARASRDDIAGARRGYGGQAVYGYNVYGYDDYGHDLYGYEYGYDVGGSGYGVVGYGGTARAKPVGGTRYGNYQFNWNKVIKANQPPAPPPYGRGYRAINVANGGSIEGTITWTRQPKAATTLRVAEGDAGACTRTIANDTITTNRHVSNAVVYLDDIKQGRRILQQASPAAPYRYGRATLQLGGVLESRNCTFSPHIQLVAPIGSLLRLSNSDQVARTVRARRWNSHNRHLLFSMGLRHRGTQYRVRLDYDGFIEIRGAEPTSVANAWLVVQRHPYYVITDEAGNYRLDDVPPGTYTLVVWHEPVVTGIDASGRPILTKPHETRRKVKVRANKSLRRDVTLRGR